MTRTAVIGLGKWGRVLVEKFDQLSDLAICCNRADQTAHSWVNERFPAVETSFDMDEVLRDPSVDAVAIATPISTHRELALRALDAGKHVFVEKPLSTTWEEARRVCDAAVANQRVLFVGHTFIFDPAFVKLVDLSESDPIQDVRMYWFSFGTFTEDIFRNLMSHQIAMGLKLFRDMPTSVEVTDVKGEVTDVDFLLVSLAFPDGRSCLLHVDRASSAKWRAISARTRSGAFLIWEDSCLQQVGAGGSLSPLEITPGEPLVREIQSFLRTVEEGGTNESDGEFGASVVKIVEQVEQTAKTVGGGSGGVSA